jgi:CheY-like chemotaxis protein
MDGYEATRQIRRDEAESSPQGNAPDDTASGSDAHVANPPGDDTHTDESQSAHPHVAIVATTAAALQGDRERCLAAGMDDFVTKPLRPQDLQRLALRWLAPMRQY